MSAASGDPIRYLGAIIESLRLVHSAADDLRRGPVKSESIDRFRRSQGELSTTLASDREALSSLRGIEDSYRINYESQMQRSTPELGELARWCMSVLRPELANLWIQDRLNSVELLCEMKLKPKNRKHGIPDLAVKVIGLRNDLVFIRKVLDSTTAPSRPSETTSSSPNESESGLPWRNAEQSKYPSPDSDIVLLEQSTPPINKTNGEWVNNKRAAKIDGIETRTLARYRSSGIANTDNTLGRDTDGRVWRRRGTSGSHPWYLRSTLRCANA